MRALPGRRFETARGIPVFVEPSHELALVDVEIVCREGSVLDPPGRDGLTRLSAQVLRCGPVELSVQEFDAAIEGLGATLGASVSSHQVRFHGAVIRRNLEPFLTLVGRMLGEPALRSSDFARQKRKHEAELIDLRDHDQALAARAFRRHLFGEHPYGRAASGSLATVPTITLEEVVAHARRITSVESLIVGIAGDAAINDLPPLLERALSGVPDGSAPAVDLPAPIAKSGRRVLLVDKPQRTQTQVYIGTLGGKLPDPAFHALLVANTGFGGTFTSRLVQEVRAERGWSYGAGSKLGADRQREAWTMWTHPAAEQVLDCIRLELELLDRWIDEGLNVDEVERSKDYLVKSHAFDLETPAKRLEPQLETALYSLPLDWFPRYVEYVRAVTRDDAATAVRTHLSKDDVTIALVATATDELLTGLASLPQVRAVDRIDVSEV